MLTFNKIFYFLMSRVCMCVCVSCGNQCSAGAKSSLCGSTICYTTQYYIIINELNLGV